MKIAAINMCARGSTGKIMLQIASLSRERGDTALTFSRKWKKEQKIAGHVFFGFRVDHLAHRALGEWLGLSERLSFFSTLSLIHTLKKYQPSLIHLHNLHGYYLHLPLLFRYIKRHHIPVVWTLHDCWAFTGHCPYFTMAQCDKWQTGCHHCPQYRAYPMTWMDNARPMYRRKKKWFTGVENMTLVTPSAWLAGLVKRSFLQEYPVRMIHNGIDLSIFTPRESDFREKYGIGERHIVLGVAFDWGARKGLDVFITLAGRLDKERYQIVMVGTNDALDRQLPANILSIHRTQDQIELAEIYTAADVFVNPTREEVLGLVNLEALACGTPGVTFQTGGSPECYDATCGSVVPVDDVAALEAEILRICETHPYSVASCAARARQFDRHDRDQEYLDLYDAMLCGDRTGAGPMPPQK